MTAAEFDERLLRLDHPPESPWLAIRERLDTPLMIAIPLLASGAAWGVARLGWIRSYTDVLLGCGIVVAGATLLSLASLARGIGARSRRARRLGMYCTACKELLVLPYDPPDLDQVAASVRHTGRCPNCLVRVIGKHSVDTVGAPAS